MPKPFLFHAREQTFSHADYSIQKRGKANRARTFGRGNLRPLKINGG
jgi:hypothetical protein